ncbi:MAG: lipoyl(octanoyl) transferase LipB [Desulfobacteraceae bacterium]|jgi:lipoate-protein ligase B
MFSARFLNLEHLAYDAALELMRGLVEIKRRSKWPEILILVEHDPIFTMGRRAKASDILATKDDLAEKGIRVHRVERGGLVTYHGPGQLIAYPIFNLHHMGLGAADLIHGLEEVIMNTLSDFGIRGKRKEAARGVWVESEKIASVGVAVRGGVSFHGLALNVDPNLSHFDLINPCGLSGVRMTSMARILAKPVSASKLKEDVAHHFSRQFKLRLTEWPLSHIRDSIQPAPCAGWRGPVGHFLFTL